MSLPKLIVLCLAALVVLNGEFSPSAPLGPTTQSLTVREDAERVVLAWSGPIAEPMRNDIAAVITRFKDDPRSLVLTLNSPGGSIAQGHAVMRVIREAARLRRIDTHVENGAVCASMCVPIYLLGTERTAHGEGQFMFHEVRYQLPAEARNDRKSSASDAIHRKAIDVRATDAVYGSDLQAQRVDAYWLQGMRKKIAGRDVWISARRLVEERSGIIDTLLPAL